MPKLERSITGGIAWTAVSTWGASLLTLVVMTGLARMLEPRAFGLVALAAVYIGLARIFVEQGFAAALVQRRELEREHLDTAFWIALLAGISLAGVSLLVARPVAVAFGHPELAPIIRWLSPSLVLTALHGTQHALLQRELDFRGLAIRTLLAAACGGAVGLGAAAAGLGVWSLVAQTLTGSAVATAVLWRVSDWRPGLRVSRRHFRELFGFSGLTFATSFVALVSRRVDDFLIGWVLGPVTLGYYVVAFELVNALADLLAGVATKVGFPAFSRLQAEPARMREAVHAATRYITVLAVPAFIGVTLVAPEFVRVAYGPNWEPSIPVLQILALLGILHATLAIQSAVLLAAGKVSWRFGITLIGVAGNVVAFLIAVRWGIVAVAIAYVLRGYLVAPLPLWALRRLIALDVRAYLRHYVTPLLAAGLMAAGVLLLRTLLAPALPPALQLITWVVAGLAIYACAVHLQQPDLLRALLGGLQRRAAAVSPGAGR